jgi:hypothetical protein
MLKSVATPAAGLLNGVSRENIELPHQYSDILKIIA